eukprot:196551_1
MSAAFQSSFRCLRRNTSCGVTLSPLIHISVRNFGVKAESNKRRKRELKKIARQPKFGSVPYDMSFPVEKFPQPTASTKFDEVAPQFLMQHKMSTPVEIQTFHDPELGETRVKDRFAVFALNGGMKLGYRQYRVMLDDKFMTAKLRDPVSRQLYDVGDKVTFDNVLLIGSRDCTVVGQPLVTGAKVIAEVEEQTKTKEIIVFRKGKSWCKRSTFQPLVTILRVRDIIYNFDTVLKEAT